MSGHCIYGLFVEHVDGRRSFFYVGRTKDVARRMRQHAYSTRRRHEDVYAHLRELVRSGTPWKHEILATVTDDDWIPDAERWEVIRLIRAGHELKNMRHGSILRLTELAESDPLLAEQIARETIRSAADVRADRERREADRVHAAHLKSRKLRRTVLRQAVDRLLGHGTMRDLAALSELRALAPVTHMRLLRQGCDRIGDDMKLADVVRRAREDRRWTEFGRWANAQRAQLGIRSGRPMATAR